MLLRICVWGGGEKARKRCSGSLGMTCCQRHSCQSRAFVTHLRHSYVPALIIPIIPRSPLANPTCLLCPSSLPLVAAPRHCPSWLHIFAAPISFHWKVGDAKFSLEGFVHGFGDGDEGSVLDGDEGTLISKCDDPVDAVAVRLDRNGGVICIGRGGVELLLDDNGS